MRSTPELLSAARDTMTKWPAIWMPPFMIGALQLMAGGPYDSTLAQGLVLISANLGAFIIGGGWLMLIRRGIEDQPARMEDFKAGVNRYWLSMIGGNVAFYMVLLATLGLVLAYGQHLYGFDTFESWYRGLKDLSPEGLNAAIQLDAMPVQVRGWLTLMAGWMAIATVIAFFLLFWEPAVVLRNLSWWRAWGTSVRVVFRRFPQALAMSVLHGVLVFLSLMLLFAGLAVTALLGLLMLVGVTIYFKVAYATLVADTWPPAVDERV